MGSGKGIGPERSQLPGNKQLTGHKLYFYSSTAPQRHTLNPHFIFPVVILLLIFHPSGQPAIQPTTHSVVPVSRFGLHSPPPNSASPATPRIQTQIRMNSRCRACPRISSGRSVVVRSSPRQQLLNGAVHRERPSPTTVAQRQQPSSQSIQAKAATCLRSTRPYLTRFVLVSKTV